MQILSVQFSLNVPVAEYERVAIEVAPAFAQVPGLQWKTWIVDPESGTAGGIYLFEDAVTLSAHLDSELAAALERAPFARDIQVRRFDVLEESTAITRGPTAAPVFEPE